MSQEPEDVLINLDEFAVGAEGKPYSWDELVNKLYELKTNQAKERAWVPRAVMLAMDIYCMVAGRLVSMLLDKRGHEALIQHLLEKTEKRIRHYSLQYQEIREAEKHKA